jgi:hypothetical protein
MWYTLLKFEKKGVGTMIDYDSTRHIEILNKYLGMEHRIENYKLTATSDLKDALEYAVAAYRDYSHYASTLSSLIESFDESIEYFDTVSWVNMTRAPENANELVMDCVGSLLEAGINFSELADKAEEQLAVLLKVTLTAPTAVQVEILGKAFDIDPSEIDEWLENLFVALSYADYHRSIPENFNEFLAVLEAGWEDLEPLPEQSQDSEPLPF